MFFEVGNCRCGQGERRWDGRSGAQNEVSIGACTSLALRRREGARACLRGGASWEGVFSLWRWFTRSGCAALGKVLCRRCFFAAGCVFNRGGLQGWDARRWVRFFVVVGSCPWGVFSARAVYKVGMRGSGGKSGREGRKLRTGSGEIPKTLEKAVEGIALWGGFGL